MAADRLGLAREELGEEVAARASESGRRLTIAEVLDLARAGEVSVV
jgi:hypothetical protein